MKVRSTGVAGSSAARASAGTTAHPIALQGDRIVQRATASSARLMLTERASGDTAKGAARGCYSPALQWLRRWGPENEEKR